MLLKPSSGEGSNLVGQIVLMVVSLLVVGILQAISIRVIRKRILVIIIMLLKPSSGEGSNLVGQIGRAIHKTICVVGQ